MEILGHGPHVPNLERRKSKMPTKLLLLVVALMIGGTVIAEMTRRAVAAPPPGDEKEGTKMPTQSGEGFEIATFAGGCFWCMEPPFDKLDGVLRTTSGYTAGEKKNPTYKEVSAGKTGHTEALQITYDPDKITYADLLYVFWRNIDPTTANRQFCDWGSQYRTGIYYHNDEQKHLAEESQRSIEQSSRFESIYTEIEAASPFYEAEEYHQDFYKKNPDHYYSYRKGCGRDKRLKVLWDDE